MPEILLILAIALIVIGPQKLPELAKSLGRAMNEFKRATNELKDSMDLDGDLKDVKKSFNDIQSNLKKKPIDLVTDGLSSKSEDDDGSEKKLRKKTDRASAERESDRTTAEDDAYEDDDESPATDIPAELMSDDEPDPPARPTRAADRETDDSETDTSPRNG
ncbi:MAG: twin-arginine translocase TatA/TatE family subunit [Desulfococcaceae bacterium]